MSSLNTTQPKRVIELFGPENFLFPLPDFHDDVIHMRGCMLTNGPGAFGVTSYFQSIKKKYGAELYINRVSTDWEQDQIIEPIPFRKIMDDEKRETENYVTLDIASNESHLLELAEWHSTTDNSGVRCKTPTYTAFWTFAHIPVVDEIRKHQDMVVDERRRDVQSNIAGKRHRSTFPTATLVNTQPHYMRICGYVNAIHWRDMSFDQKTCVYEQLLKDASRRGNSIVRINPHTYTFYLIFEVDVYALECHLRAVRETPDAYLAKHGYQHSMIMMDLLKNKAIGEFFTIMDSTPNDEKNIENPKVLKILKTLQIDTHSFVAESCPSKYRPMHVCGVYINADEEVAISDLQILRYGSRIRSGSSSRANSSLTSLSNSPLTSPPMAPRSINPPSNNRPLYHKNNQLDLGRFRQEQNSTCTAAAHTLNMF